MTRLTPEQIAQHALAAGFRGDGAVKAVAVALAESGGRTDAVNRNSDKYRSVDRGLWQINSKWHPEVSAAQAFNPATAARHAYRISSGGKSWSPWSAWKNGAALTQLGRARLAVAAAQRGTPGAAKIKNGTPGSGGEVSPEDELREKLRKELEGQPFKEWGTLGDALPDNPVEAARQMTVLAVRTAKWLGDSHNWVRIVYVVAGSAAVLYGAAQLAGVGLAPKQVASTAMAVMPQGKAAKAVGVAAAATPTTT